MSDMELRHNLPEEFVPLDGIGWRPRELHEDMYLSADTTIAIIVPHDVEERAFSTISNNMDGGAMFVHGNSVYILQEPDGDYEIVYRVVDGAVSVEARMIDGGMDD